ncbi:MAG: SDR family NAD(P)-dependent oxidoreductase [Stellaceae bacterium]
MNKDQEKTASVTGSTDGVGRVVAKRLAGHGVCVLVHERDRQRGERVVAEITATGGKSEFLRADFASLAEVRRFAGAVKERIDRLDILINNAGIGTAGAERQASDSRLQWSAGLICQTSPNLSERKVSARNFLLGCAVRISFRWNDRLVARCSSGNGPQTAPDRFH